MQAKSGGNNYVQVPCGTCHACCKDPWYVTLQPWEKSEGVSVVPKKDDGSCIHLVESGCALFGKPERPYECQRFDCRDKLREWNAKGRPEIDQKLSTVIWAALKRI